MTRKLAFILLTLTLTLFSTLPAFAAPIQPYSGFARGQGVDTVLNLVVATLNVDVGVQQANLNSPMGGPAATDGAGNGVTIALTSGILPGASINLINASSSKVGDGNPAPMTDSAMLLSVDTLLLDSGMLSTTTTSHVAMTTAGTEGSGGVAGLTLFGNPVGTEPLVQAGAVTEAVSSDALGNQVVSASNTQLEGASVSLGALFNNVLTADTISATVAAISDGTIAGASASSNVEFINLIIAGTDYSNAVAGTVVTILDVVNSPVARVTIKPVMTATTVATQSDAAAVALRIEVLNIAGLTGTRIDLGQATVRSSVSAPPVSSVGLTHLGATPADSAGLPLPLLLALGAGTLAALAHLRRR